MPLQTDPPEADFLAHFTIRARKVLQLAIQEAQRLGCDLIGTEHMLLGLVKEDGGVAAKVLKSLRFDLRRARSAVEKTVMVQDEHPNQGRLEFDADASGIIFQAIEEANRLMHVRVSTGHLLLALLAQSECRGQQVIAESALVPETVREEVLACLEKVDWEPLENTQLKDDKVIRSSLAPPIAYAVLQIWSDSMDINEMTKVIGIEPSTWRLDGQIIEEGKPAQVGNSWVLVSSSANPVADITDKLRSQSDALRKLISQGAKAHLACYYRVSPHRGLPILRFADSMLIADLGIDVLFRQDEAEIKP